jgi:RNA recognition motif-containing protein
MADTKTEPSALDHPNKVFAGNLSFKTTEDELKSFFGVAGTVVQASIITRGPRSLGYGFVAYNSADECQAAVDRLHKKDLGGREINVEIAKPKSEIAASRKDQAPSRPGRRFRGKPRPRVRKSDKPADDKSADDDDKSAPKKRKPRKKKPAKPADPDAPKRAPRPKRVPTGEPSKTTIFVANLPFSLDDEGLKAVFKDFKVKTAKVILRRASGRSKGFGFVDLEEEAEQEKVLAGGPYISQERELNLKIALADERHAEEEKKE